MKATLLNATPVSNERQVMPVAPVCGNISLSLPSLTVFVLNLLWHVFCRRTGSGVCSMMQF